MLELRIMIRINILVIWLSICNTESTYNGHEMIQTCIIIHFKTLIILIHSSSLALLLLLVITWHLIKPTFTINQSTIKTGKHLALKLYTLESLTHRRMILITLIKQSKTNHSSQRLLSTEAQSLECPKQKKKL